METFNNPCGPQLIRSIRYDFRVTFWVGYLALFGIAVETGAVVVDYLHESTTHVLINTSEILPTGTIVQCSSAT